MIASVEMVPGMSCSPVINVSGINVKLKIRCFRVEWKNSKEISTLYSNLKVNSSEANSKQFPKQ